MAGLVASKLISVDETLGTCLENRKVTKLTKDEIRGDFFLNIYLALKFLFLAMGHDSVRLEMADMPETFVAVLAFVRKVSGVDPSVMLEPCRVHKHLATNVTLEGLVAGVGSLVTLQIGLLGVRLAALGPIL